MLDIVVLNAGVADLDDGSMEAMDADGLRRMMEINTMGVFHGLAQAGPHMRDGGSVIVTATAALDWAFPDYMAYTASKAPLRTMAVHAAMKLGSRGIRVNTVSPGTILTEMQPDDDPEARITPFATCLGRVGTPDDVTGAYLFLAGDDSAYVTGTDIRVDGGWLEGLTYASVERLLRGTGRRRGRRGSRRRSAPAGTARGGSPGPRSVRRSASSVLAAVTCTRKPTSFLGTNG